MSEDSPNSPRSWLEKLSDFLMREPKDREELLQLLREAEQRKLLNSDSLAMIEGVLQVSHMQVRDIMVPRSQMVSVGINQSLEELLPTLIDSAHSRFPVMDDNYENVVGILLAKDLLQYYSLKDPSKFILSDILRVPVFIPESKRLDILLREFRDKHNHMAIVVDEYGGIAGLVTIEDVLEQIVGEIEDEYDIDEEEYIKKHSERKFTIKAITPIEFFNEYFSSDFNEEEVDTIGGIVVNAFGYLPKRGESITLSNFRFKVLHADNRRIRLLSLLKL